MDWEKQCRQPILARRNSGLGKAVQTALFRAYEIIKKKTFATYIL
jgi:hypothetical protein